MAKGHRFTEDEYKQILGLLNKDTKETNNNMTGMDTCLMSKLFSEDWIVDSGASHHITSNKYLLKKNHSATTI